MKLPRVKFKKNQYNEVLLIRIP